MTSLPAAFGRYTLTDHLGRGGMADVYLAMAPGENGFVRLVVIKRMFAEMAKSPAQVEMFTNEAKIAARLSHPNVAQVYELSREGDELYMALEYVRGRDLARLRNACPRGLPPLMAAYIAREVCRALQHAHEQGVLHRDISPHNIMIGDDGQVKLVDFGIAKARDATAAETRIGVVKGKAAYLSPEQIDGHSARPPSDLFALGVVLHECLTGQPLFHGASDLDTMIRVKMQPVEPPSQLEPSVPPELDAIVLRALERDPEHRYQRAAFMIRELDEILSAARFGAEDAARFIQKTQSGALSLPPADMPTKPSIRSWPTRAKSRRASTWILVCLLFLCLGAGLGMAMASVHGGALLVSGLG